MPRKWARALRPITTAVGLARSCVTPMGRSIRKLANDPGSGLLQPSPLTRPDRHAPLFAAVRDALAESPPPAILSFGCSTGEEAITLARYLPSARIDAIDINPLCIERARAAARDAGLEQIRFACANAPPARPAHYDAIFCLSVLRHGRLEAEAPESCASILPFSRFAEILDAFDLSLKPAGYLILWACNFRLADTPLAKRYRAVPVPKKAQPGPFYGPDNRRLEVERYGDYLFRKLSASVSP